MGSTVADLNFQVPRCYDSHVHWLPTGQLDAFLNLHHLSEPTGVADLEIKNEYFRGKWLIGFGWNQHNWSQQSFPDKSILDRIFPDYPVYFSRADGHAVWTNSLGLKAAGLLGTKESEFPSPVGGSILRGSDGLPTGVLIDKAMGILEQKVPPYSSSQLLDFLRNSTRTFNQGGFTHIRDLGGDAEIWNLAQQMYDNKELSLAVEMNFTCSDYEGFESALHFCKYAKAHNTAQLRAQGVKFFLDGALGSEGAYLSQAYRGTQNRGLLLCKNEEVRDMLRRCWESDLEAAAHAIGDEACHILATEAYALYQEGIKGTLNIEHGEVIRDETIEILKSIKTKVHLQPCHWLTDKKWLESKLDNLFPYAFPWRKLEDAGIEIHFGSDSPIEKPSLISNLIALEDSQNAGIARVQAEPTSYHRHPDSKWCGDSCSIFENGTVKEVVFMGESIDI